MTKNELNCYYIIKSSWKLYAHFTWWYLHFYCDFIWDIWLGNNDVNKSLSSQPSSDQARPLPQSDPAHKKLGDDSTESIMHAMNKDLEGRIRSEKMIQHRPTPEKSVHHRSATDPSVPLATIKIILRTTMLLDVTIATSLCMIINRIRPQSRWIINTWLNCTRNTRIDFAIFSSKRRNLFHSMTTRSTFIVNSEPKRRNGDAESWRRANTKLISLQSLQKLLGRLHRSLVPCLLWRLNCHRIKAQINLHLPAKYPHPAQGRRPPQYELASEPMPIWWLTGKWYLPNIQKVSVYG